MERWNGRSGEQRTAPPAARKPGILTTEFWSVAGALTASLTASMKAEEASVRIAGIVGTACLGCVLGGLYIWSRTQVKTWGNGGGP